MSWAGAKSMMADGGFLRSLQEFDKDGVKEKDVKKVKDYMKASQSQRRAMEREHGHVCT